MLVLGLAVRVSVGLAARFATGELFMERRLDSRVGMEDLRGDWYCETDTCLQKSFVSWFGQPEGEGFERGSLDLQEV